MYIVQSDLKVFLKEMKYFNIIKLFCSVLAGSLLCLLVSKEEETRNGKIHFNYQRVQADRRRQLAEVFGKHNLSSAI